MVAIALQSSPDGQQTTVLLLSRTRQVSVDLQQKLEGRSEPQ